MVVSDFNRAIIEEFRANGGKVGGYFADATILLLHTIGAKSGQMRINPLVCTMDGERIVIIASKSGAPTNPDWFYNLRANSDVVVELGTEQFRARATIPAEPERTRLFEQMVEQRPGFGEYQRNTTRQIPVVLLERVE